MSGRTFVPRYYEIEQALRARIVDLEADAPLPSDAQLCREFGVSRMTARNAVQRLVQDGLVYRLPGRGTFVAGHGTHRHAGSLTNFSDEMRRQGRVPTSRIIRRLLRPPTEPERAELRVARGEEVVELCRVRLADGVPVALETAVLAPRCAPVVMRADLETGSLHEALIGAGILPSRGKASIGAEAAGREDARQLGVQSGEPMLVERRLILDQRARPLERTESRYAASRYGLDVGFSVEDSGAITVAPRA